MFQFANPQSLWLGLAALLIGALAYRHFIWRQEKIQVLGSEGLIRRQLSARAVIGRTAVCTGLSVLFVAIALALPQIQKESTVSQQEGSEVILAVDISTSMLATDVAPNRMEQALRLLQRLLEHLGNDRVGLITFAGFPYLQTPLTTDRSAVLLGLENASPRAAGIQGTNITATIQMAAERFTEHTRRSKTLILISDGEGHEPGAKAAAEKAFRNGGIIIQTVGVGSGTAAPVPDWHTRQQKTDKSGKPVFSKLDEGELIALAKAGGGTYRRLSDPNKTAADLAAWIANQPKTIIGKNAGRAWSPLFQPFLLAAIIALVIGWWPWVKKGMEAPGHTFQNRADKPHALPKGSVVMAMLAILLCVPGSCAQAQQANVARGNALYAEGKYQEAAAAYLKALQENPKLLPGTFNLGNALLKSGRPDEAIQQWQQALQSAATTQQQAAAGYNIGTAHLGQRDWQNAVNAYRRALQKNPDDADAKYNLSYALKMLKQQQQQQKNQQQQNQQQPQNKPDQNPADHSEPKPDNQPKPAPSKLSRQQADQILDALAQQERRTGDKLKDKNGSPARPEKDW